MHDLKKTRSNERGSHSNNAHRGRHLRESFLQNGPPLCLHHPFHCLRWIFGFLRLLFGGTASNPLQDPQQSPRNHQRFNLLQKESKMTKHGKKAFRGEIGPKSKIFSVENVSQQKSKNWENVII